MAEAPKPSGRDLPPVAPPSGRFIAQLFLVPGLIVFFVVLLVIGINYMFVGGQRPNEFLQRIDSDNADIRWRGANDLAQVLERKESVKLRSDVGFALDLCERLDKAVKVLEDDEAAIALAQKTKESPNAYRKLDAQRNFVNFLAASLRNFNVPAGAPSLCAIVVKDEGSDIVNGATRRRLALWSLANLGDSIKGYKALKPDEQALILALLRNEQTSSSEVRRKGAKNALKILNEFPDADDPELIAIDQTIDVASKAEDQYLRELAAYALNFWDGPLAESTLLRLTTDQGFGTLVRTPKDS
ncbi:MAG: hypothetical protein WCL32_18800 [Planctomycetota bacterium]